MRVKLSPNSLFVAVSFFVLLCVGIPSALAQSLYSFTGTTTGDFPVAGLIMDASGNLYGTTEEGGTDNDGTVFELVNSSGTYSEKVLYSFTGPGGDGENPYAGLIMDASGNLYGTTSGGGTNGFGIVFELVNSSGTYSEKVLHSFNPVIEASPYGGLIMDASGNLYGTTSHGSGGGTVFELVNSSGTYSEKVLYSFAGFVGDGENPYAGLIIDASGNLYGTTSGGGTNGVGTVFELVNSSGTYSEKVLYSFSGEVSGEDGAHPYAGLIIDASGNLYGTTLQGGTNGYGTVFELVNSSGTYSEKVLYSFSGEVSGEDGAYPYASLFMDPSGDLYATTLQGGTNGYGTVFELVNSSGTYSEKVLHSFTGSGGDGENPYAGLIMDTSGNLYGTTEYGGTIGYGSVFELVNGTTFTVGVTGSFTVNTTGVPVPALSETGALPGGVAFVDNGNGTGTLSGTPVAGSGGTYAITFTANNGVGTPAMQSFTLTVNSPSPPSGGSPAPPAAPTGPAITSASSASFTVLAPGSFTVTTTGYPTPALAESGTLPSGVTFTDNGNGTGALAGTPASGTAGTYPITLTASSSAGSTTQPFTLTVDLGVAITSGTSTTFTVGSAGSFTVTTVGTPTPALSETGSLPSGVTFVDNGNGTGTLSGTPASGTTGNYPLTFTASNSVSSATQNFTLTVNQGPAITSGSATTFAVGTAGSFLVTATGTPTPALTESGTLPSGVTFVDNGNGTATLSGTPAVGSGGSYPLSITAANGVGTNATQSFTLTINQSLAITSGSMTTFTVGSTGFFSVTTTGFPVPSLTESGSLPNGVTFTDNGNGTATLSGTPAADSGGTYPLTITAANGGVDANAMQSFTLVVNQSAAILTGNSTTLTVGVAGSFTVNTTGVPVPALSETGALPGGVAFVDNGNATGTLSGTPLAGSGGSYAITLTANNGVGTATMQSFTLTVNQGPAITSTNTATFAAQVAGSFTVTTTGDPTPALSETGSLPSGVTFVDNGNGTATLSGTPAEGTAGQYGFTIQASNGVLPNATQTFTLTIAANTVQVTVGTSPAGLAFSVDGTTYTSSQVLVWTVGSSHTLATTSPQTATAGTQYTFTNWSDGGAISHSVTAQVATSYTASFSTAYQLTTAASPSGGGTVSPASGAYYASGTVVNLTAAANSGYSFSSWSGPVANANAAATTVTMNAPASVTANFALTTQPPAITSASSTTFTAGTAGSFTVTTTGTPTPSLSESGTLPSGVTFVNNGNGTATLSGTPRARSAGTYPITITASNSAATASQNFTLRVSSGAPAITSASSTTFTVGTAGSFTVTTTGTPTPWLSESGTLPSGVTFVNNGNGTATLSGTPRARSVGTYPITITASNSAGTTSQNFTLTVSSGALAITSASSTTFAVGTAGSFTVTTTGTPTPSLSESGTLPSGVTFVNNGNGTATLSGTPASGTGGSYAITITITASNSAGTASQSFTLTVDQAPAITSASSTTLASGTAGSFTVTTTGTPTPWLSESGTLPSGVTFVNNGNGTATLSGTPRARSAGTYPITITASNSAGTTNQSFTLTVDQALAITSASSTTFTVGTAGSFMVTTTGTPTPSLSESGTLPSGVTFVNNGNGTATLSGTPASGTGGGYAITITASNSAGTASQSFTLTVDQALAITSASSTTFTVGTAGSFTVTTTGTPTPWLSESGTLPSGVTLVNNGNGTATLSGTPRARSVGTYPITITASNSAGTASQSFTLTVSSGALAITSASGTTFTVGTAGSFTVTTTGTPTPSLSESGTLPSGVTFVNNGNGTATLSGTPRSRSAGTYPITITASNSAGTGSQNFTLTVQP